MTRHSDNATDAGPDDATLGNVIFGDLSAEERAAVAEKAVAEAMFGEPDPVPGEADRAAAAQGEATDEDDEEELPSFTEQVAEQLGGVRGLLESSIPVVAFVLVNVVGGWFDLAWKLNLAIVISVATAISIAGFRLSRRQPIRHAVNGLFGIALGAWLAWRSGDERDFYLPGIWLSVGYAIAMVASIAVRQPLVGWIWSVVVAGGSKQWREEPPMVRTFGWLTGVWAAIYIIKSVAQWILWELDQATALGIVRLVFGYPPYLLLLALTVWAVRRTREQMETAA